MITIKRYPSRPEADLAKSLLESAGIHALVLGLGVVGPPAELDVRVEADDHCWALADSRRPSPAAGALV